MGAIFENRECELLDRDDGEDKLIVLHRSTGKHPYPAGEYHIPVWGPWFPDSPMWTRNCVFDAERIDDFGRKAGCDLDDHTFTNPMRPS